MTYLVKCMVFSVEPHGRFWRFQSFILAHGLKRLTVCISTCNGRIYRLRVPAIIVCTQATCLEIVLMRLQVYIQLRQCVADPEFFFSMRPLLLAWQVYRTGVVFPRTELLRPLSYTRYLVPYISRLYIFHTNHNFENYAITFYLASLVSTLYRTIVSVQYLVISFVPASPAPSSRLPYSLSATFSFLLPRRSFPFFYLDLLFLSCLSTTFSSLLSTTFSFLLPRPLFPSITLGHFLLRPFSTTFPFVLTRPPLPFFSFLHVFLSSPSASWTSCPASWSASRAWTRLFSSIPLRPSGKFCR